MKIKETLVRDPSSIGLVNQGQARIADTEDASTKQELKGELQTFVCEGQFADGMQRIIGSYLDCLGRSSQKAAWVSGFYGSGKSHLLKMLCHLWADTKFEDGASARALVPHIPEEVKARLIELDTAGRREGGLIACAGSMPSGSGDRVRATILGILFRGLGLPTAVDRAQFVLWLNENEWWDQFATALESAGRNPEKEIANLFVSPYIPKALLQCKTAGFKTEEDAKEAVRKQFGRLDRDLDTSEFIDLVKRGLKFKGRGGKLPCAILVLDEVQIYIGDSGDRATSVSEAAEALCKELGSRLMLVCAGQSALVNAPQLQRLIDRFAIPVNLSEVDVEKVTRTVLLQKRPTSRKELEQLFEKHAGEIARQLQGTRVGRRSEDAEVEVEDYPLLPVRRRLWEMCFRELDSSGAQSQLRSQLRIIFDALKSLSDKPVGHLIPGDELFNALAPTLVQTGMLSGEINARILELGKSGKHDDILKKRICALIYLINRLPRQQGLDSGIRANKEHLADLLIDDLNVDNTNLREQVQVALETLAKQGVLMRLEDEFRLQTREGAEWDIDFKKRQSQLANNPGELQIQRSDRLFAYFDQIASRLRVRQGEAKESRNMLKGREQAPPPANDRDIPIWFVDGWTFSEKHVLDHARSATSEEPTVYVFVPKVGGVSEELNQALIEMRAAQQVIESKGVPNTDLGRDALRSMENRKEAASRRLEELVRKIVESAKVVQAGGNEVGGNTLEDKLHVATTDSLARLFPRFREADSAKWEEALKQGKDKGAAPFKPVGYEGPIAEHPVCKEVLAQIGSGRSGGEVRKSLGAKPFGWPQDAIDAALIALHSADQVQVALNGQTVQAGSLDQNKISKAQFRRQNVVVGIEEKLKVKRILSKLGLAARTDSELADRASQFVSQLVSILESCGGDAPLPAISKPDYLIKLESMAGNELLTELVRNEDKLNNDIHEYSEKKRLVETRKRLWSELVELNRHAQLLPQAEEIVKQIKGVENNRSLLQKADPVSPLKSEIAGLLRKVIKDYSEALATEFKRTSDELKRNPIWAQLKEEQRKEILADKGLLPSEKEDVSTDERLVACLNARPLASRQHEVAAVSGRTQQALEAAARLLEPEIRTIHLPAATLRNEKEVKEWVTKQEGYLVSEVKKGPIHIS